MSAQTSVLFLDGIGCNPAGFKPRFIAGLGYRVTAPNLPDLDFSASVEIANRAAHESQPEVIVGYSRGASVAMMMQDRQTPRLLIAPALHWVADGRGTQSPLVVLHSATDDGLPLEDVREHLGRCGLTAADLRIVGDDHSMIDPDALAGLERALAEMASAGRPTSSRRG